jgi:hypothetical protein
MHAYEFSHTKTESRLILLGNPNVYTPTPPGLSVLVRGCFPPSPALPPPLPPTCEQPPLHLHVSTPPSPLQLCSELLIFQVEKTA